MANFFYPTKPAQIPLNLLNSCIKRLLGDGFNIEAIKSYVMKSQPSNVVMYIKTIIILLRNFSYGLINFVDLSTPFLFNVF